MERSHEIFILLWLVNITVGFLYTADPDLAKQLFQTWKLENGKEYNGVDEEQTRFDVFYDNIKTINKYNKMYQPETIFALNKFADMSPSDFQSKILMSDREPPTFENDRYIKGEKGFHLPDSFDWVPKNVVTSVKNQGAAGSCWAFSTIENVEGQWALSGQPLLNLSVEQVVDCDGFEDISRKNADCGVFGGWPYLAYQYIMKTGGIESSRDYGYCSGDTDTKHQENNCLPCPPPGFNSTLCGPAVPYCNMSQSCVAKLDKTKFVKGLKITDWKAIDKNETNIAEQLMKIGPLSIAMNADWLMFYHSGISSPYFCNPKSINHAVLLVGFGKEKTLFGETLYWKVKNSWGSSWGEKGYFRIKRNAGTCGINTQVTTAMLMK
ncbi:cathepsin L-like [Mytilus trossulus]|uniref:cathepsin L-like n=1 Tax=Mytilus trossulus TaxID=6551 RepID=UPI00300654CE